MTPQVKALEDELGVPLFDRSGERITLTSAYEVLPPLTDQMKESSIRLLPRLQKTLGEQAETNRLK